MDKNSINRGEWPFPFFGHGLGSHRSNLDLYLWFKKQAPSLEQIKSILSEGDLLRHVPLKLNGPIGHFFLMDKDFRTIVENNPGYSPEEFPQDFENQKMYERFGVQREKLEPIALRLLLCRYQIDEALLRIHQAFPLVFCLETHVKKVSSPWHEWSGTQITLATEAVSKWLKDPAHRLLARPRHNSVNVLDTPCVLVDLTSVYLGTFPAGKIPADGQRALNNAIDQALGLHPGYDLRLIDVARHIGPRSELDLLKSRPDQFNRFVLWDELQLEKIRKKRGGTIRGNALRDLSKETVAWLKKNFKPEDPDSALR